MSFATGSLQCARYIELNPVRANIVSHPSDYFWSSYSVHALGGYCDLINQHPLLRGLGSTEEAARQEYKKFVETDMESALCHKSDRFSKKPAYGSKIFIEQMKEENHLFIPRPNAGRPAGNQT